MATYIYIYIYIFTNVCFHISLTFNFSFVFSIITPCFSDGEAKQQSDESKEGDFNYPSRGGAHPPATPPPNFNGKPLAQRERMWSA